MKKLLILTSLLFAQFASAETCYQLTQPTYDFIPQELCFDFLYLDAQRKEVVLKETKGQLPAVLRPEYVARRNENGYRFISTYEKLNEWPGGCESGKTLNIIIEGQSDNDGYVDATFLNIKAQYVHAWDSCHSRENKGVITYQLKR
jgi:hypothetical protein